jgi:uncharacterized protein YndB with AHSA1/START domain
VPEPFRFDRSFELDATPEELWSALSATDRYPEWWSWLRVMEGGELREGTVAHCVVRAPLPYTLRFDVGVESVVPRELVDTQVSGDLDGPARLEIAPRVGGCTARLIWSLHLRDSVLRPLAFFARPAMTWAHDRVIEMGLRQFERHALNGRGGA